MTVILQNAGTAELFLHKDSLIEELMLAEEFGRTCYQSYACKKCKGDGIVPRHGDCPATCPDCHGTGKRPITKESSEKFFKMIEKRGHESVFEHIPIVFELEVPWSIEQNKNPALDQFTMELSTAMNYVVGIQWSAEAEDSYMITIFTISMNLRTLRDWVMAPCNSIIARMIMTCVQEECVTMVERLKPETIVTCGWGEGFNYSLVTQSEVSQHPEQWYRERHGFVSARFSKVSRGFTHELVRHRLCAFSQESTRYVDEEESAIVLPPDAELSQEVSVLHSYDSGDYDTKTFRDLVAGTYDLYKLARIQLSWPKEDARQFLPIGLANEIVCTTRLSEWQHIFRMRTSKPAHWEIREVMVQLLQELQIIFPGIFDRFKHVGDCKKGIPYYEYMD